MDFERLAQRHRDAVYRQMVRVCGNRDDAEDVLVEALLSAHKHLGSLRDETAFRGWLATIGRRVCGKIKARESLAPLMRLSADVPAPLEEPDWDMARLKSCVQAAVRSLPEPYRAAYEACDLDGLARDEAAARLGVSLPALKSRLHRARNMIREALDRDVCLS